MKLGPELAECYVGAGALVTLGERERGCEWADRAVALTPDDAVVLVFAGAACAGAGRIPEALTLVERGVARDSAARRGSGPSHSSTRFAASPLQRAPRRAPGALTSPPGAGGRASARLRLTARSLGAAMPNPESQGALARRLEKFLHRRDLAAEETRTLAVLRDSLLPKPVSGELRVREAERIVGRAI